MLGKLHSLLCAGIVAALGLKHCCFCFERTGADDAYKHYAKTGKAGL